MELPHDLKLVTVVMLTMLCLGCSGDRAVVVEDSSDRRIVRFDVASANVYVVEENDHRLMIDAGNPGDGERYATLMRESGIDPATIDFAILTHGHIDHAGTAAFFQERYGIQIIGGIGDKPMIEAAGDVELCPTSITAKLLYMTLKGKQYPAFQLDREISATGDTVDLAQFGVTGKVIPHSGHTPGSMVITIGPHAFVGDLIRGEVLRPEVPATHFFMCDLDENRRRIAEIMALEEVQYWHPGHFGPFTAAAVGEYLIQQMDE
jgi:glyoxylase-like metal-dependent hydrolase (beta-lactamase superfamily II)